MAKIHEIAKQHVYWRETIENMRKRSLSLMEDGRNIQAHFNRMVREYSDWEDRLKELDEQVDKLAAETGLTVDEIHSEVAIPQTLSNSSVLDSLFDDDNSVIENKPESKNSMLDDLLDMQGYYGSE